MSQYSGPYAPRSGEPPTGPSTTDVARDEAAGVGQHAREAGGQVAQTAGDQARQVAAETGRQARDLLGEAQGQVQQQAAVQQQRAAQQLHSVADELGQLASNSGQSGVATEFARQAAGRVHGAASWLEQREPADLLEEVRHFARRRPGAFLIGAAVAGLAAGRLTRGLKDRGNDQQDNGSYDGRDSVARGLPTAGYEGAAGGPGTAFPTETYPAAPAYAPGPQPVDPTAPAYPAEPGYAAGSTGSGTPGYPADPIYETGPATPADPVYPPEPGAAPRFEEPR
ncbi:MAG: hypothetical protein JO016_01245 [Actinobacteria bacterium]|nr:hypothetical protein [Actinomycetota bacterium]